MPTTAVKPRTNASVGRFIAVREAAHWESFQDLLPTFLCEEMGFAIMPKRLPVFLLIRAHCS
jgi:hypothetical protein